MIVSLYLHSFAKFCIAAITFTALSYFDSIKCNNTSQWWKNKNIFTDFLYFLSGPLIYPFLKFIPVVIYYVLHIFLLPDNKINFFLSGGFDLFSQYSPLYQALVFFLLFDFLMYWSHRLFHKNLLWPIHLIHHSSENVNWTTAYRFHPLNLVMGSWLITAFLLLLGISPENIIFVLIIENIMAFFVHSNLNITLGPLKYFIATPVFHRWHHTFTCEGGESNYGAILACWDVVFGTYYLPANRLPKIYGTKHDTIQENFFSQIIYPFAIYGKKIYNILKFTIKNCIKNI